MTHTINFTIVLLTLFFVVLGIEKSNAQTLEDCSTCSTQKIKASQLSDYSIDDNRLLLNEIFARNGYTFESPRFSGYFYYKDWYNPKDNNDAVSLNKTEEYNVNLIKEKNQEIEASRKQLVNQLKQLKKAVLASDYQTLKNQFHFDYNSRPELEGFEEDFKQVMHKLELESMGYYRHKGYYGMEIDDGFLKTNYSIGIDKDQIFIGYGESAHSEIIEDINEYTDYCSECIESYYTLIFEFKNNRLTFSKVLAAG